LVTTTSPENGVHLKTVPSKKTRSSRSTTGTSQICVPVTGPDVAEQARFVIGVRTALKRYRIMAYVVGIGLIVLVLIGVPLQYGAGIPQVAQVVGPIHGAMYIVYLVASVDLARRGQLATRQLAMIVLAGFVPLFAFVVERKITRLVEGNLAGEAGPE